MEPGFLIQGSLRSFIPPNKVTKKGPKIMEKGEVRGRHPLLSIFFSIRR